MTVEAPKQQHQPLNHIKMAESIIDNHLVLSTLPEELKIGVVSLIDSATSTIEDQFASKFNSFGSRQALTHLKEPRINEHGGEELSFYDQWDQDLILILSSKNLSNNYRRNMLTSLIKDMFLMVQGKTDDIVQLRKNMSKHIDKQPFTILSHSNLSARSGQTIVRYDYEGSIYSH